MIFAQALWDDRTTNSLSIKEINQPLFDSSATSWIESKLFLDDAEDILDN